MKPKFLIYSSGYNCSQYVEDCLKSVRLQTYQNYLHLIVDDASTDDTFQQCQIHKSGSSILRRNLRNVKWMETAVNTLKPENSDIVVILDLDDRLFDENVLQYLADFYASENCWFTYGSYVRLSNPGEIFPHCREFPQSVLSQRSFRKYPWITSHLRSFKGFLWNNLKHSDLKDAQGKYLTMANDVAVTLPMLEMCKIGKIRYISRPMYIYNDSNLLNNHKVNENLQKLNEKLIKGRNPYSILNQNS